MASDYDPCKESREQFEARYQGKYPHRIFDKIKVAMKCTCEDGGGPTHWAAIRNTPEAIRDHRDHEECLSDLRERHGI